MPHLRDGQAAPAAIFRADYQAPAWWIDSVELTFDLDPAKTRVLNRMRVRRNAAVPAQPLRLDGEDLNLARVLVGGAGTSFKMEGQQLVLENLPEGTEPVELEIFTTCAPEKNTQLSGLYVSQGAFFTQCEAEGFRRITYFLDRPDVMASFTVLLRADKAAYPVLLSNGNLVEQGELDGGRHFAKWVDPHKKPCYLFALVAGTLVARQQRILSRSGQEHLLEVYVRPGDLGKTEHAMNSLMASVAWDEARFNGGYEGYESPDGKLFYYSKGRGVYGIYSVPADGGDEKLVPELPVPELKDAGYWRSWTVVNQGICFPIKKSDSEWAIQLFNFATRRTSSLFTVTDAPLWWMPGLALSSDGRRLIYAHLEQPYDELMLMENFR